MKILLYWIHSPWKPISPWKKNMERYGKEGLLGHRSYQVVCITQYPIIQLYLESSTKLSFTDVLFLLLGPSDYLIFYMESP